MPPRALVGLAASIVAASSALAQPPSYGFDFVTIGAPGNRAATIEEAPDLFPPNIPEPIHAGDVAYEYRITRTEVTVGQWFEFVNAYWPHSSIPPHVSALTGFWIKAANPQYGSGPWQNPGYSITPGAENRPTDMSWHMAARFCNWLHNGKVNEAWAFESGAYDTSTFTKNPNNSWNDQSRRSEGAQFWIPSLDEWTKAMYYDPDKNGPGEEGYWRYPHSSDAGPIPGLPWEGGETNAGLELFVHPYLDVGSYPWAASPWGLLDGSGGEMEWTEDMPAHRLSHTVKGSRQFLPFPEYYDRVDYLSGNSPTAIGIGLRIASIPTPGSLIVLPALFATMIRRKR